MHTTNISKLEPQARQQFSELLGSAQSSFERGNFELAIDQLSQAYAIYPFPRILYKLAEAKERNGQLQEARDHYSTYLETDDSAEDRARIQGLINNLDKRLSEPAMLVLSSTPQGALVYLNDQVEPIGATPLRYPLAPGAYDVRVEAKGHASTSFTLDAKYGAEMVLDKTLPPTDTKPTGHEGVSARGIGLASAGLGIGAGVLFMLARGQAQSLDAAYEGRALNARPSDLDAMTSRHNAMLLSGWALSALSLAGSAWSITRWRKESTHLTLSVDPSNRSAALQWEVSF